MPRRSASRSVHPWPREARGAAQDCEEASQRTLPLSVALLVAQSRTRTQAEAGSAYGGQWAADGFKLQRITSRKFMLSLADVFVSDERPSLVTAPEPARVPKRTADRAFREVARGDLCTTRRASRRRRRRTGRAPGRCEQGAVAILPEKDAKAVFRLAADGGEYYDLDADCLDDSSVARGQLLRKVAPST